MSLPEEELRCPVCLGTVVNAVVCTTCDHHFCEGHSNQLKKCPTCRSEPLRIVPNPTLRKLADRVRVKCHFCVDEKPRGELALHEANCQRRPRQCGAAGCEFSTCDVKAGLTHLATAHEAALWDEFEGVFKWSTILLFLKI